MEIQTFVVKEIIDTGDHTNLHLSFYHQSFLLCVMPREFDHYL